MKVLKTLVFRNITVEPIFHALYEILKKHKITLDYSISNYDDYRAFVFISANMICYYAQILVAIICVIKVKEATIEKYALINEYCFCMCMVFVVGFAIWVMNSE